MDGGTYFPPVAGAGVMSGPVPRSSSGAPIAESREKTHSSQGLILIRIENKIHTGILQARQCILVRTFCGKVLSLAQTTNNFASTRLLYFDCFFLLLLLF
jgi:hypothetical protein